MTAIILVMALAGAGGVQRGVPIEPRPPEELPIVMPPAPPPRTIAPPPIPPAPPLRPGTPTPPVLLRAPPSCVPHEEQAGEFDFSECFNGGDYPISAWRAGEEGVASVRVTLGADGRPNGCDITVSSGSQALDQASCALLGRRIAAASDAHWAAVTGTAIAGKVAWVRPPGPPSDDRPDLLTYFARDDYPATALRNNEQGTSGVRIDVGENGRVINCALFESSGSAALDTATCRIIRSRARYLPARDGEGRPVPGRTYARVAWRLPVD